MKETLAGLAAKTGFSITTISRVLSGKAGLHRISPETREQILTAARVAADASDRRGLQASHTTPQK